MLLLQSVHLLRLILKMAVILRVVSRVSLRIHSTSYKKQWILHLQLIGLKVLVVSKMGHGQEWLVWIKKGCSLIIPSLRITKRLLFLYLHDFYFTGLLKNGEKDMSASGFIMKKSRAAVIDYLPSLMSSSQQMFIRNPAEQYDWTAYILPLTKESWIALLSFCILVPFIMALTMSVCK